MDFEAIAAALKDTYEVEILHPTDTKERGWFIELAAPHHASAQTKVNMILDRIKKRKGSTASQDEQDGADLLAARIVGWRGLKSGEVSIPYSHETCIAILTNPKSFWVKQQLVDALGDTSRPFTS